MSPYLLLESHLYNKEKEKYISYNLLAHLHARTEFHKKQDNALNFSGINISSNHSRNFMIYLLVSRAVRKRTLYMAFFMK